jgi:hypothetical protein
MDQHKKRRLQRWALHRRDRFLTLLGSLIIFATFVVKEGVGENQKDLVSSIAMAQQSFILRGDIASGTSGIRRNLAASQMTADQSSMMLANINIWNSDAIGIAAVCADLADSLPDKQQFKARSEKITHESDDIWKSFSTSIENSSQTQSVPFGSAIRSMFSRSFKNAEAAEELRRSIVESATRLKEQREAHYNMAKWISYALFTFGWGLTFYGQLSGKDIPTKPG